MLLSSTSCSVVVAPSSVLVSRFFSFGVLVATSILYATFLAAFFYHDSDSIDNIGLTYWAFVMIFEPLPNTFEMEDMIALIRLGPTKRFTRFKFT
jgi:hypothetical protein